MNTIILKPLNKRQSCSFVYGEYIIHYGTQPSQSSARKVIIKVSPDQQVLVAVPSGAKDIDVDQAIKKRQRWIYNQIQTFKAQSNHSTSRQYVSGETHLYLGRKYQLKIIHDENHKQNIKLIRGKFEVYTRRKDQTHIQSLLMDWYKVKAKEVFNSRLSAMLDKTLWIQKRPSLRILSMKTQWGSCSSKGMITLNPHLIKSPKESIDYVILHELCHIAEHNHSEKFYRLMSQVMPDWKKIKNRLDDNANIYLP